MPVEKASVMLVTDTSGSMNATDVAPDRLTAAKAGRDRFLDRVPEQLQTGLVAFADGPHTVLRPTQDRVEVAATLDGAAGRGRHRHRRRAGQRAEALGRARRTARRPRSCCSPTARAKTGRDPAEVAQQARAANVPIYTVALGTADGVVEATAARRCPSRPTPRRCAEVAEISGGRAFAAEDADALDEVYETLGSRIGTKKEKREVSAGFAAFGLLALAGAAFTSLRWRGRLP